ncbi:probable E3 ubiquitin-protein ligase ZFP1 [Vigna unguiculata]|uniref:probable E3 ubiquitin-protein ligase ZFP1 n=1 Tax=Vigna unguiculata TaxID=3917 RepID=UPI001016A36F|nr:probable E3 ubiquitin-protein ligase ZFP1 [Vigna unguiculata]
MAVRGLTIDSHFIVDSDENGMVYGMTQHHVIQHHHSNHFIQPNYLQAPLENTRMGIRRRHRHVFHHRHHHVQEIRGHSNFHSHVTVPSYRAPTTTHHSRTSSIPIQNAPRRANMHSLHPPAFRELPSYLVMDADDMSYETFSNMQESFSLDDPQSDMRLDIDGISYEELLELGERLGNGNGNLERGLSEDVITRQMPTKSFLLPENLEGSTSEDRETDLCIICQDDYKNKEEIGILQCGHEYHADCIKRWLIQKNICPMCKSKALTIE